MSRINGKLKTSTAAQISSVLGIRERHDSWRVFQNRSFQPFKQPHFSESRTSIVLKLWRWSIFFKMRKIVCTFQKRKKKFDKMFLFLEIMAFETVAGTYLIYDEHTCDWQSTCYQTILRFYIWIRKMFSNSICHRLMEKLEKSASAKFRQCMGPVTTLNLKVCSETRAFGHSSNHIFRSQ